MNACLLLVTISCLFASTFAVKCFVCTSLEVSKGASENYTTAPAYKIRQCQSPNSENNCTTGDYTKVFSIASYYKGQACAQFDKKVLNSSQDNIVECKMGCAKIQSNVMDRGVDVSRTTRQCAFYDKDIVGKYIDQPGFKRTGAGSDKVSNWFYYCSSDYCNAASGISQYPAIMIASFYAILAFLNH